MNRPHPSPTSSPLPSGSEDLGHDTTPVQDLSAGSACAEVAPGNGFTWRPVGRNSGFTIYGRSGEAVHGTSTEADAVETCALLNAIEPGSTVLLSGWREITVPLPPVPYVRPEDMTPERWAALGRELGVGPAPRDLADIQADLRDARHDEAEAHKALAKARARIAALTKEADAFDLTETLEASLAAAMKPGDRVTLRDGSLLWMPMPVSAPQHGPKTAAEEAAELALFARMGD